ncbi:MAG: hypothetical protein K0U29_08150 [Gammaproteobacteria bacterium]|nr:hypothetical protein [Gammaproteobacteria bacterium]MCH9744882.1 hypothetical protein [Gammaproteobacteria bacterium]
MIKHSHIAFAIPLLLIMGSAMATPQTSQCDQLINASAQNQTLSNDFYKANLPAIKSCLENCNTLYSGADVSTCKSNLGSMEFNANLSLAVSKASNNQKPQPTPQTQAPAPTPVATTQLPSAPSPLIHAKDANNTTNTVSPNINTNPQQNTGIKYNIRWD